MVASWEDSYLAFRAEPAHVPGPFHRPNDSSIFFKIFFFFGGGGIERRPNLLASRRTRKTMCDSFVKPFCWTSWVQSYDVAVVVSLMFAWRKDAAAAKLS